MSVGKIVISGVLVLGVWVGAASAGEDCGEVGARVKEAVEAELAKVLVVVEEAVEANEGCACEIVKAAIEGAGADENEELLKQIVVTALNAAEKESATIAECAVAAAPESAAAVKEAMRVALGASGNGAGYGKQGVGKEVLVVELDEGEGIRDWVGRPVTVDGLYLIPPLASAGPFVEPVVDELPVTDDPDRGRRRTTTPPPVSAPNGVPSP